MGATDVRLYTNTVLSPAVALYRKFGFRTVSEGPHPLYARCNIVMEKSLEPA
jgi:ribosomal protein S18 acetylase RimI-like enzyme